MKKITKIATIATIATLALTGCNVDTSSPSSSSLSDVVNSATAAAKSFNENEDVKAGKEWLSQKATEGADWASKNVTPENIDSALDSFTAPSSNGNVETGTVDMEAAKRTVDTLNVRSGNTAPAYDRDVQFGDWAVMKDETCTTRERVLIAYAHEAVQYDNSPCTLAGGYIVDAYSGERMDIIYGPNANGVKDITIEHVVSAKDAWESGAHQWSQNERVAFYNDTDNLVPLSRGLNSSKSDKTADQWTAPTHEGQCKMVGQQVMVKAKWNLSVTASEHAAMKKTLAGC